MTHAYKIMALVLNTVAKLSLSMTSAITSKHCDKVDEQLSNGRENNLLELPPSDLSLGYLYHQLFFSRFSHIKVIGNFNDTMELLLDGCH